MHPYSRKLDELMGVRFITVREARNTGACFIYISHLWVARYIKRDEHFIKRSWTEILTTLIAKNVKILVNLKSSLKNQKTTANRNHKTKGSVMEWRILQEHA